ncbi:serine--tRNA ligase [Erythrobacter sp. HI0019]|uniref:serine--tRNA ligase n=1 Tax=unclassified Erythrobacter TaxID=2633097 RepID=UPI0007B93703|nr:MULTISPECIES: serine--tRNA ligase [unclassified Erythrobacter]KZX92624.1 serine--tRNA ligase [Erythrobacter sp. HI0019]KZY01060.1 serine--tRNA ligase [Erythrobacter sp. HI0028]
MHDIAYIRSNPQEFDAALARRGAEPVADRIVALDAHKREATTRVQQAQSRRNEASKAIGQAMGQGDKDKAEALKAEVAEIKASMPEWEEAERAAAAELDHLLATLPNLPAEDVPDGADESDNVELAQWGEKRSFDFNPREHADIGPALGMDFETGTKLSGARFTFLRGDVARLHRALAQFMLDKQTRENGYTECNPPVLVGDEAMYGTDKLPKFAEDSFFAADMSTRESLFWQAMPKDFEAQMANTSEGGFKAKLMSMLDVADTSEQFWLVPTSEVPLTASVAGEILPDLAQPIRLTAHTLCFRSEAGSAGRDTRGFIRQHQFEKVEMVSICRPEDSVAEHERMTKCAEGILEALDLPYRRMLLCTGDMGFGARKTYDLEVWLPGQGAYREISSCSNTGDFQARRMNARYRPEGEKKTAFVHTLNGSGLAVGRTLVAVMENYQQADGSVAVPEALAPYMGGVTKLEPAA